MEKVLTILRRKRVQGAVVIAVIWILQQLGVDADKSSIAHTLLIIIQALGGLWGIWGVVDAYPGHNKPPA